MVCVDSCVEIWMTKFLEDFLDLPGDSSACRTGRWSQDDMDREVHCSMCASLWRPLVHDDVSSRKGEARNRDGAHPLLAVLQSSHFKPSTRIERTKPNRTTPPSIVLTCLQAYPSSWVSRYQSQAYNHH